MTTFTKGDRVYWLRPPGYGNGEINTIPATVIGLSGARVTIEAWGTNGTTRVLSVRPRDLKPRETLGDAVDRIEKRKDSD